MPTLPFRRPVSALASMAAGMTLLLGCAHAGSTSPAGAAPVAHDAAHARSAPEALRLIIAALATAPAFDAAEGHSPDATSLTPGLYALDRLATSAVGNTVTIRAQRPCTDVIDELQAGQWTMRTIPADQNPLGTTMALLSYGQRLAMVYLKDGDSSCVGSVTVASQVDLTVGGALTAAAQGVELPLYCHVGPNPDGDDLQDLRLSYFGLFTTPSGSFVVMLGGPATAGTHELTTGDDESEGVTLLPLRPEVAPTDAALTFLSTFFAGQGDEDDAFAQFTGMFYGGGTLTVTSTNPLEATLETGTLAAYDDEEDDTEEALGAAAGQTLTLTASLHCDQ